MENTLNIQIKITDEQISSLITGKLENLPEEKIQEIFCNALTEFFKTENGRKMFYTQTYYSSPPQPTQLLTRMVENAISKDLLKPCVDEFIETIKNNYEKLIRETMIQTFSKMFVSQLQKETFQYQLNEIFNQLNNRE